MIFTSNVLDLVERFEEAGEGRVGGQLRDTPRATPKLLHEYFTITSMIQQFSNFLHYH